VRAFRFPVPPDLGEQREIVAGMTAEKAKLQGLARKEAALRGLKRALMDDLFGGRVRVDVAKVGMRAGTMCQRAANKSQFSSCTPITNLVDISTWLTR
jgi:hypothetical protein